MPATTVATIDNAVRRFVAESRYTMQEKPGVVKGSISHQRLPENEGPTVYIPKYGTVTTSALTEGVDMATAQQITDGQTTVTPAEYGAQVVLTDMMLMTVKDAFFTVAGKILGESFDRQQDQTLCDDFDNYSFALGSAATVMNIGHVMAAHASIKYNAPADATAGRGGEPAPDPVTLIHTPAALHALAKSLTGGVGAIGTTQITPDRAVASYQLAAVPGLTIKADINISKDTSDDAKGGVFSREAQILVTLGKEVDSERERDASLRAWEVDLVGRWARVEYNDSWGREMLFDSALPTA